MSRNMLEHTRYLKLIFRAWIIHTNIELKADSDEQLFAHLHTWVGNPSKCIKFPFLEFSQVVPITLLSFLRGLHWLNFERKIGKISKVQRNPEKHFSMSTPWAISCFIHLEGFAGENFSSSIFHHESEEALKCNPAELGCISPSSNDIEEWKRKEWKEKVCLLRGKYKLQIIFQSDAAKQFVSGKKPSICKGIQLQQASLLQCRKSMSWSFPGERESFRRAETLSRENENLCW